MSEKDTVENSEQNKQLRVECALGDTVYVSDCDGILQTVIDGTLQRLVDDGCNTVPCFVNSVADATTIAEIIECCGYTYRSVIGKRVRITIEEIT
jgi:hypothetical protein